MKKILSSVLLCLLLILGLCSCKGKEEKKIVKYELDYSVALGTTTQREEEFDYYYITFNLEEKNGKIEYKKIGASAGVIESFNEISIVEENYVFVYKDFPVSFNTETLTLKVSVLLELVFKK